MVWILGFGFWILDFGFWILGHAPEVTHRVGYFWVTSQLPSGWVTSGYFWTALQSTIYNLQSTIYNVIPRAVDGKFGAPRRGWSIPWLVRGCFAYAIDSVVGPLEHMADCDHGPDAHFGLKPCALTVPKTPEYRHLPTFDQFLRKLLNLLHFLRTSF